MFIIPLVCELTVRASTGGRLAYLNMDAVMDQLVSKDYSYARVEQEFDICQIAHGFFPKNNLFN